MTLFTLRTPQQIVADMISTVTSQTQITDVNDGSVILTLLEAAAIEDANTYIQMLNIIRAYNIDNLSGSDLDARAFEYGLVRGIARKASGYVTFTDTAFTKVQTTVFSGLPGPSTGSTTINIVSATGFPTTGSVIIGRNTNNAETVSYTSITNSGTYFVLHLNVLTPLTRDHGTDETVILSQGGTRTISAGTVVYSPAGDNNDRVDFTLQTTATILPGETTVENNTVIANTTGISGNVGAGRINTFATLPFPTATVTNPQAFSSGSDIESDPDLRERIKNYIQSLSRGVIIAITSAATQVISLEQQNKVFSAKFVEATTLNELNFLYIDDGTGLEPLIHSKPYELVLNRAAGTETFLHLDPPTTPLLKAALVTQNLSPYNIPAGETLTISVNGVEETITFGGTTDFADPTRATAEEVAVAINNRLNLVEARTTGGRTEVIIQAKVNDNERIACTGGTANNSLAFVQNRFFETLKLYKNDQLLIKDGDNAHVDTGNNANFTIPNPSTLIVVVDNKVANPQTVTFTTQSTAPAIAAAINAQLSGAIATSVNGNTKVRITSLNPDELSSYIQVTGGTANNTGGHPLNFPTTLVRGRPKDYVLNKYNGQIELSTPLVADDQITAGSPYTQAYIEATAAGTYSVTIGQLLIIQVDDIISSTVTTSTDTTHFSDASLTTAYTVNDHFVGLSVRFTNTTTTVALQGVARTISAYNAGTGAFTLASAFPAVPAVGDAYEIVQIITIPSTHSYTADVMAPFLNPLLRGANFYAKQHSNGDLYLRLQTNSFGTYGRIRVHPATTALGLSLPSAVTSSAQESNYAFVETGNEQLFTIGYNQNLIVVLDNDPINKTFDHRMQVSGIVTTSTSTTAFSALALATPYTTDNFFTDFRVRFNDATPTVALRGQIRTVATYTALSGAFTVSAAFGVAPAVNDIFELIPTTAKNVADLFSNSNFSNLAFLANTQTSNDGTKVQISSKNIGSAGSVQVGGGTANSFSIPFLSNGTAGPNTTTVASIEGLSVGLNLYAIDNDTAATSMTITNITGVASPYTITTSVSLAPFTITQSARFTDLNQFRFSQVPSTGVDGYRYHGGLIQQTQWTIDGRDDDLQDYPGIKAAGVQIEVNAPTLVFVTIVVNVTTIGSLSLSAVTNDVKAAISAYVNSLGVGKEVILSEVIANALNVYGIVDVQVTSPSANIVIQDHELARITDDQIFVT